MSNQYDAWAKNTCLKEVVDPESNRPKLDVMPEWATEPFLDNFSAGFVYTKCFYLMFIYI